MRNLSGARESMLLERIRQSGEAGLERCEGAGEVPAHVPDPPVPSPRPAVRMMRASFSSHRMSSSSARAQGRQSSHAK